MAAEQQEVAATSNNAETVTPLTKEEIMATLSFEVVSDDNENQKASAGTLVDVCVVPEKGLAKKSHLKKKIDEITVSTKAGPVHVTIEGDLSTNPQVLVTYHDVGLNHHNCFDGFFRYAGTKTAFNLFTIVHIDAPGHERDAARIDDDAPQLMMADLAEQVHDVLEHLGVKKLFGFGVGAGVVVLTHFASLYPQYMKGMITVGGVCEAQGYMERLQNMYFMYRLRKNGLAQNLKETFVERFFSFETTLKNSNLVNSFRFELDKMQAPNVIRYLYAFAWREDLTKQMEELKFPIISFTGACTSTIQDTVTYNKHVAPNYSCWMEIPRSGLLVTEENPNGLLEPLKHWFAGQGYFLK